MDFWDNNSVIVNISYCVNIVLVFSLIFTIFQLRLSYLQHQLEINNRKVDIALTQSERFISEFLSDYIEYQKIMEELKKITPIVEIKLYDKSDFYQWENHPLILNDYYENYLKPHRKELSKLFNQLESISVFFLIGEAEIEVGYKAIGNDFVDIFEKLYPDIQISSNYSIRKYVPHTIELYKKWKPKKDLHDNLFL